MRCSDRLPGLRRAAGALIVLVAAAGPVAAECFTCDEVVEFDRRRAECFRKDYAAFLKAAEASSEGKAEVDLTPCVGGDGSEQRGGLEIFGDPLAPPAPVEAGDEPLRSVFILDAASMVCLRRLLDQNWSKLDPKLQFDLFQQCTP